MRFLIINSKKQIKSDLEVLIDLLSVIIDVRKYYIENEDSLIVFFNDGNDISFAEIILTINADLYSDYRIYVSKEIHRNEEQSVKDKLKCIYRIPFEQKWLYLDDKEILKYDISSGRELETLKKETLKKYYSNKEMLDTIKVYLEENQNMSLAAKKLYLHRNTLIQRIERFNSETGLDVKRFIDGYLVYHLL